jgi:tetratricopeptide (TPR) repeat protein
VNLLRVKGSKMAETADYYFKRAEERFNSNDADGGFADLDEAIRLDPTNPDYFWQRGLHKYEQGELDAPISDFTKTIELTSDLNRQAEAYRKRLVCYRRLNQCENLLIDTNWLIEHGFGDRQIYEWQGFCRNKLGQFEEAIQDYTKAIQLSAHYDALYGRANAYYRVKRYQEAIQDLTQVLLKSHEISDNVYLALAYQQRAFAYYRLSELDKSFHDFNEAQRLHGQQPFSDIATYIEAIRNLETYELNSGNYPSGLD